MREFAHDILAVKLFVIAMSQDGRDKLVYSQSIPRVWDRRAIARLDGARGSAARLPYDHR